MTGGEILRGALSGLSLPPLLLGARYVKNNLRITARATVQKSHSDIRVVVTGKRWQVMFSIKRKPDVDRSPGSLVVPAPKA
jgi:hypothetical protein